jgi:hypothetical protein
MKYEYTPLYYGTPCQVKYWDPDDEEYIGGIAIHDYLICGCCGSISKISDIIAAGVKAGKYWDDVIIELSWRDIHMDILHKN